MSLSPLYEEVLRRLDVCLQRRGQRRTPERATILRAIYEELTHFDAETLHKHLQT
ncbi:MAG: hypothetical protein RMK98_07705 [Bacteroidia bacterium]|nr:hypothetical protein [Bacteroidia bacterium]